MKTPEQMAEEYGASPQEKDAFLAGYQAAKDEYKVAIDIYNDVAKQMMEEAVRIMSPKDQLADASKVMNSPEKPDSCDHIVDISKMVNIKLRQACDDMLEVLSPVTQAPINDYIEHLEKIAVGNTSNNSNDWISVKERLPEDAMHSVVRTDDGEYQVAWREDGHWFMFNPCCIYNSQVNDVTHWQLLPEPPKEEK